MPVDTKLFQPGKTLDLHDLEIVVPGRYPEGGDLTGQWLVERLLGKGENSVVLAIKPLAGGPSLAMKLAPYIGHIQRQMRNEFDALSHVQHTNVLKIWAAAWRQDHAMLFTDLVDGGTLWDALCAYYKESTFMPLPLGIGVFEQTLRGLGAVHAAGFAHCDLKPENILRKPDGFILSDFGFAQRLDRMIPGALGSPVFMAPEVYAQAGYSPQSDVFAAGCMLQRLLGSREPYFGVTTQEVFAHLVEGKRTCTPEELRDTLLARRCPKSVAEKLSALVLKMTAYKREDRPSAQEAIELLIEAVRVPPPSPSP